MLSYSGDVVAVQWRRGEGSSRRGRRHRPGAGQLGFDSTEGEEMKEPEEVLWKPEEVAQSALISQGIPGSRWSEF